MSFAEKLLQAYFNYVYNPVYDFTTGRLNRYQKLQGSCINKLDLKEGDKILCVGLGTGNEILHILRKNSNVKIVGVDYSNTALRKAYKKALKSGKEIDLFLMDARHLEFPAESFDKVLCLHVIDFVGESKEVNSEIIRVLKKGGQYVITYPSDKEGPNLGRNLLKDSLLSSLSSGKHTLKAYLEFAAQFVVGCVYLPLLLRPKKRFYSRHELESILFKLADDFKIEEEPVYQDFIVYGIK